MTFEMERVILHSIAHEVLMFSRTLQNPDVHVNGNGICSGRQTFIVGLADAEPAGR